MYDYFFYSSLMIAVAIVWGLVWLMIKQEERALNEWRNSDEYKAIVRLRKEIKETRELLDKVKLERQLEEEAQEPENREYIHWFTMTQNKSSKGDNIISGTE